MLQSLRRAVAPVASASTARGMAGQARRLASVDARRIVSDRFGAPSKVLRMEEFTFDDAVADDEVVVEMTTMPVTNYDLAQVKGFQCVGAFPQGFGNEGLGKVVKAGAGVSDMSVGDYVLAAAPGLGTWSTHVKSKADNFCFAGAAADVEAMDHGEARLSAAAGAPVLAECLLQFANLEKGDVVALNAAEGPVAQCVNQICAERGIVCVNIGDDEPDWQARASRLEDLNYASINFPQHLHNSPQVTKALADVPRAKLALDGSGGATAISIARMLEPGATMVSYDTAHGKPVVLPSDLLLERGVVARGFNLAAWSQGADAETRKALVAQAVERTVAGKMRQALAWEAFADFDEGVRRAQLPWERSMLLAVKPEGALYQGVGYDPLTAADAFGEKE